jgi:CRP-like cAMP-binding protein
MPHPDQSFTKNLLLTAMSVEDFRRLQPYLDRIALDRGMTLVPANGPADHVYFPEAGVGSIVSETPGKGRTEVGIFGREGMSATFLLLGAPDTPHESFVQVGGAAALRIETARLLHAVEQSETLRTTLLRYVQVSLLQTAQSAASNAHQRLEARLARWLLMCHDRVDGDEIALTHEFMGMMIAADRSGVTVTLHILEGAGMIRSLRGRVIVRDRAKLLELADDGYGMPEAQYSKLLTPFGKGAAPAASGS